MVGMRNRLAGFTLLEVLVALSLLGVLMTLVYTGMHTGMRSWDAVQQHSDAAVADRATRNWLKRQIGGLVPMRWRDRARARIAFDGDQNGFRFLGARTHTTRGGGLYRIELSRVETDGRQILTLVYRVRDTEKRELVGVGEAEIRRLGDAFESIDFAYFGAPTEKDARRWRPSWPGQAARYPELIRVSGRGADGRNWPPLVVPVRNAPTGRPL